MSQSNQPNVGIRREESKPIGFSSTLQIGAALVRKKQKAQAEYVLEIARGDYHGFLARREKSDILPGKYATISPEEPVNFCLYVPLVLKDKTTNKVLVRYWGNFTEILDVEDPNAVGVALDLFADAHKKNLNYLENPLVIEMDDTYVQKLTESALDNIYRKLVEYRDIIEFVFPSKRHLRAVFGDKVNSYGEKIVDVLDGKIDLLFKLWDAV